MLHGVPNFYDVVSNIPFLIVGALGLYTCMRAELGAAQWAWLVLFIGVTFVSVGSAYYHWNPNNGSLVWDRLPMTVGFMGLFVALVCEYTNPRIVRMLLIPAVVFGAATILYWHLYNDLRFYAWVQFMPVGVVSLLLLLYEPRFTHRRLLVVALSLYVLAKIAEEFDVAIFSLLNEAVSGHTIKHLFAAACCYSLVAFLKKRLPNKSLQQTGNDKVIHQEDRWPAAERRR